MTLVPIPAVVAAGEDASIRYRSMMPSAVKLCNRECLYAQYCAL